MPYKLNELHNIETRSEAKKLLRDISLLLTGFIPSPEQRTAVIICLLYAKYIYITEEYDGTFAESFWTIVKRNRNLCILFESSSSSIVFEREFLIKFEAMSSNYNNPAIYASIILIDISKLSNWSPMGGDYGTPKSIIELVLRILNIQDGEKVADICCGRGDFISQALVENANISVTGYEINGMIAAIAGIRAEIIGKNIKIHRDDTIIALAGQECRFDKIFLNYPFGLRITDYSSIEEVLKNKPYLGRNRNYDWIFIDNACKNLKDGGKAAVIVPLGLLWNAMDEDKRAYFAENGYIESVILLPEGMFAPTTSIQTALIILSKGNQNIRLVDASHEFEKSYSTKANVFSENNLRTILMNLAVDSDTSLSVSLGEIKEKHFNLSFKAYRSGLKRFASGRQLSEIAEILRGGVVTGPLSGEITDSGIRMLKLSDMENGMIKKYLQAMPEDLYSDKMPYLEYGDIVISRSASPCKVALCDEVSSTEKRIIPSGNLFIVRAKNEIVDPNYLLAFLLSDDGVKALDYAATGTTIKTISVASLRELVVPVPDMTTQKRISEEIKAAQTEVAVYEQKIRKAEEKINNAFNSMEVY